MSPNPLTRRTFIRLSTLGVTALSASHAAPSIPELHPLLTPDDDFYDVSRGNPKPHTLQGAALAEAKLTSDTWRL